MNPNLQIGVIAHNSDKTTILCYGDACLVFGTEANYRKYIKAKNMERTRVTYYAKLHEIVDVLKQGGTYQLDEEAYSRFEENDISAHVAVEVEEVYIPQKFYLIQAVFPKN